MPSVSDYIKLSADEDIIKEYRGFVMKKPQKAALHIAVTSKRLIFYGMSKAASKMNRPSLTQDVRIDDIRGLEIYEKREQNTLIGILGAIITLAGLFGLYSPTTSFFFTIDEKLGSQTYGGLIFVLAGLAIFLISFAVGSKVTAIVLKGKNENLNTGIFQEKTVIGWGSESQKILCELGSVILDIQDGSKEIDVRAHTAGYTLDEDNSGYEEYRDENYDEVFESGDESKHSDNSNPAPGDDYSQPEVPGSFREEELGKELGTGSKRDDYLF